MGAWRRSLLFSFSYHQYNQPKTINQLLHLPYTRVPPGLLKSLKSVSLSISSDLFIEVAPIGVPAPSAVTSLSHSFEPI